MLPTLILVLLCTATLRKNGDGGRLLVSGDFNARGTKCYFVPRSHFVGKQFSKFKPFCTAFRLMWKFLGRRPKPALLFLIAEKEGKKASTPGSHKIYFYPGVLQLPTVKQIKRLYNSVKNKFYRRLQRGAKTATATATVKQQQQNSTNGNPKKERQQ